MTDLWDQIESVNAELEAGEPGNVSVDTHSGWTGYDPQALYDAVNRHLGPENWRFETKQVDVEGAGDRNARVTAQVVVSLRITRVYRRDNEGWEEDHWVSKGPQFGGAVQTKELADAKKAAVTDAVKKALSAWSIGNRAFLGLLEGGTRPAPAPRPAVPVRAPQDAPIAVPQANLLADMVGVTKTAAGARYFTRESFAEWLQTNYGVSTLSQLKASQFADCRDRLTAIQQLTTEG